MRAAGSIVAQLPSQRFVRTLGIDTEGKWGTCATGAPGVMR